MIDRRWLPLNALRAFEQVGRHLSFTAAASALSVSQSAVSRHVIALEGLLGVQLFERKPGAFANYRYQSDLFPGVMFRVAYDYLREHDPAGADRQYVRILQVAASESEQRVDEALRFLIEGGETITADRVREWVMSPVEFDCRDIEVEPVQLTVYDSLLGEAEEVCA